MLQDSILLLAQSHHDVMQASTSCSEGEKVPPSTTEPEGAHTRAPETKPFLAQPYGDIATMLGQIVEEKVAPLKTMLSDVVGQMAKMETRMTTIALDLDKQPAGPSNRPANGNQYLNHAPPLSSKSCDPDGGGAMQFAHGSPEASQLSCHNSPQITKRPEEHVPHCKDGEEHPELHDSRATSPLCSNPCPTRHSEHHDSLPQSTAPEQSHPDEETADPKPSSHNESPTTNATPTDDVPQSPHTDARHEDNKDLVDYVFPDMSESVPGTSGSTSSSSHEDLELSEGWLAEIFNDAEMEDSSDNINVSGPGDDLIDVAELDDTQPANEQHVVQQHVSRSHPIIVIKGRKSMDLMPTKLETSVTYPFAFIKPSGAEGDVTLKEINKRIQTLPSSKPKAKIEDSPSYPKSAFSGKPVGKKDLVNYVFPDLSELVPGTSGSTSPFGHEDLELSEAWLAQIFSDAEMEDSSDNINVSGSGDDLIDIAELDDTQPALEQHVVQQHFYWKWSLIIINRLVSISKAYLNVYVFSPEVRFTCVGKKSMDLMPTKWETSVTYPFAFIKPSGAEGDVTLKEINQRIQTLEDSPSYPKSAFSGKPVVSKVKVHTKGRKGSITVIRTID
ncbi:hypothetical protein K1719_040341 [Acacia pycnantha]|nr:hypothetical protein K1719_040341 [Acacia pycnantha]